METTTIVLAIIVIVLVYILYVYFVKSSSVISKSASLKEHYKNLNLSDVVTTVTRAQIS